MPRRLPLFRCLARHAGVWALVSPLIQAGLWLAGASPVLAYGRLIPVLTQVPGPTASAPPRPLGYQNNVAVLGATVLVSDTFHHQIFQVSLADGTVVPWAGTGVAGDHLDPHSALNTQLNEPRCLCVRQDRTVLVADQGNHRVLLFRTTAAGAPGSVEVFAGTGSMVDSFDPSSPLRCSIGGSLGQITECQDRSVLVVGQEVMRIRDGAVTRCHVSFPIGLLERDDHSIAILDRFGVGALVDAHGADVRDREENRDFMELCKSLLPSYVLARGPEHSLLIGSDHGHSALYRWHENRLSLLAGVNPPSNPRLVKDPSYDPTIELQPLSNHNFGLQVMEDGSILMPTVRGAMLLSPADALQATLEDLVKRGKAAVRDHQPEVVRAIENELANLCVPIRDQVRRLNRAAREDPEQNLKVGGRALPADLVKRLVLPLAGNPVYAFRAQSALRELRDFQRKGGDSETERKDQCIIN